VQELAFTVPIEESIRIQARSIMGTEIPHIKYDDKQNDLTYAFGTTKESIDIAREAFRAVKNLTIKLAEVENAAYRLAANIKKTQKRANALKNITIPMYSNLVYTINNALEEKDAGKIDCFDGGVKGYKVQKITYDYMKNYEGQDEFVYEEEYCDENGNKVMDTQILGFFLVDHVTLDVTDEHTTQWH